MKSKRLTQRDIDIILACLAFASAGESEEGWDFEAADIERVADKVAERIKSTSVHRTELQHALRSLRA